MSGSDRRTRGAAMMRKVYADVVPAPVAGQSAFGDLMLEQLFAEVWTREALSVRDRRLLTMGVIAALGEQATWASRCAPLSPMASSRPSRRARH